MAESSKRRQFSAGRSGKKAASREVQQKLAAQRGQRDKSGKKPKIRRSQG